MNAALEFLAARMVNRLAIRSSGCNEIIGLEDIWVAFGGHIRNVGEVVENRDDATPELRDFREGVNFPTPVGRDEGLPDPHVGG